MTTTPSAQKTLTPAFTLPAAHVGASPEARRQMEELSARIKQQQRVSGVTSGPFVGRT